MAGLELDRSILDAITSRSRFKSQRAAPIVLAIIRRGGEETGLTREKGSRIGT